MRALIVAVVLSIIAGIQAQATTVAVVGCSQTESAWIGWTQTGDVQPWQPISSGESGYWGGGIIEWYLDIPDTGYWSALDTNISKFGEKQIVWWQLCGRSTIDVTLKQARDIMEEIKGRFPGAVIYASPLAVFEDPTTCLKMGIENSQRLVKKMVRKGAVLRGPILPKVRAAWISGGDQGCHVGPEGRAAFGAALSAFAWE